MFRIQMLVILCHNQSDGVITHDKLKSRGVSCWFFFLRIPQHCETFHYQKKKIPLSKNKSSVDRVWFYIWKICILWLFSDCQRKRRSPSRMEAMSSQRMPALSCELESEENRFQKRKRLCCLSCDYRLRYRRLYCVLFEKAYIKIFTVSLYTRF